MADHYYARINVARQTDRLGPRLYALDGDAHQLVFACYTTRADLAAFMRAFRDEVSACIEDIEREVENESEEATA